MAKRLDIIAQSAMDLFYSSYKGDDDFFSLEDFIIFCGNTFTDLLLQEYRIKYQQLRQEKKDEVVSFSSEWLMSEIIEVKEKDGEIFGVLSKRVMSFPFDKQGVGLQDVQNVSRGTILERSNSSEAWEYRYIPMTERIFWSLENRSGMDTLIFFKNGICNVKKVKVSYVPSPEADTELPDAVASYVINTTVSTMKQVIAGTVVEKTNDGNPNKVLQSEINKSSLQA